MDTHASNIAHSTPVTSTAEAYLHHLKRQGIEYLYLGSGTDTAPLVEAYARQPESQLNFPQPILATHENLAVGMAHGYYMVTRRPQAVMLHVSVGAANAVCAVMNAARAQVPMLFTAGRTPLFEKGRKGARDSVIHWDQEMYDQGAMLREVVKWDYELRDGANVSEVINRGLAIAMTEPRGPVYLTLPRETLAEAASATLNDPTPALPSAPHPDPHSVEALAKALLNAELPIILCGATGVAQSTVNMLVELSDRFGIGVAEPKARYMNFPSSHPLHMGFDAAPVLKHSDAVLFLECDVPWIPEQISPLPDTFVAHAGCDPLFAQYPLRCFPSDLTITTTAETLLPALIETLQKLGADQTRHERAQRVETFARERRELVQSRAQADTKRGGPISKLFLSRCISEVKPNNAIVVNEYSAVREQMTFDEPGTFYLHPTSAGLGWGLPAALGAAQAAPDRVVISVVGDGAYIFCNPAACHQAATMHKLPLLTIVFNNGGWDAVQRSALAMYPNDHAAQFKQDHHMAPLSSLDPTPDFERYVEASGGYGERVTERDALIPALQRALNVVQNEKRQALLHVIGA